MRRQLRLAFWLRRLADRLDPGGAPKITHWTFTFEPGQGTVFRNDGKGCPVAFLGDGDYERAHNEADYPYPASREVAVRRSAAAPTARP